MYQKLSQQHKGVSCHSREISYQKHDHSTIIPFWKITYHFLETYHKQLLVIENHAPKVWICGTSRIPNRPCAVHPLSGTIATGLPWALATKRQWLRHASIPYLPPCFHWESRTCIVPNAPAPYPHYSDGKPYGGAEVGVVDCFPWNNSNDVRMSFKLKRKRCLSKILSQRMFCWLPPKFVQKTRVCWIRRTSGLKNFTINWSLFCEKEW